ncbi:MAG: YceD family protein [Symbiobacteriaceae bacterium]|nr:YceD family protein [Symbiobacteriaceae bacterium]
MLLTVTEVKRHIGAHQDYNWEETALSLELPLAKLQDDIWLDSPAKVHLRMRNGGDRLLFEGEVKAQLKMLCGRCLTEFTQTVVCPIEEQLLFARPSGQFNQEPDDDDADRELAVLEGDTVDATDMVRSNLIASLPMKPLCKEECRGLCPICGVDLNQESCSCSDKEVDPRLAALAQWLEKKEVKENECCT